MLLSRSSSLRARWAFKGFSNSLSIFLLLTKNLFNACWYKLNFSLSPISRLLQTSLMLLSNNESCCLIFLKSLGSSRSIFLGCSIYSPLSSRFPRNAAIEISKALKNPLVCTIFFFFSSLIFLLTNVHNFFLFFFKAFFFLVVSGTLHLRTLRQHSEIQLMNFLSPFIISFF